MVGVKGKYKGCNTCRGRRVKCDNTRPLCRNCVDHGRVCEGYERETVFIVGTVDDKGRCASHPPRNLAGPGPLASSSSPSSPSSPSRGSGAKQQQKKKAVRFRDNGSSPPPGRGAALLSPPGEAPPPSASTPASTERTAVPGACDLASVEPWAPAWSDGIALGSPRGGTPYRVRFLAIRTRLGAVVATPAGEGSALPNCIRPTLPPSCRASERPRFDGPEPFCLASRCFLRLPLREREGQAGGGGGYPAPPGVTEEGLCLFLYEQSFSAVYNNNPPWKAPTAPGDDVLARGPAMFQTFPAHHFFARVYRPVAILTALLTRTPSPLAAPQWTVVPYGRHPKTSLDALLDTVALVPGLLARADRLRALAPDAAASRLEARNLVAHGAALEARLGDWYAQLERAAAANRAMPLLYWTTGSVDFFAFASASPGRPTATRRQQREAGGGGGANTATAHIPFADTYEFASTVVGLGHVVYWTALMTLYECMDRLVPVVLGRDEDGMPAPGPALEMGGGSGGSSSSSSSTVGDATAAAVATSYGPPGLPPACDPARYQARERRKLAANICRSLDWVIGPSGPDASSFGASLPPPAFPSSSSSSSSAAAYSSSPPPSSSSLSVPLLSSSISPSASSSPSSSSSSSWLSSPPPLLSGAAGSVTPLPSPQPDPAGTCGGGLGPVGSEPRDDVTQGRDFDHHDEPPPGGGTGHPDLASMPLWVVEQFYDGLGADGALERAWCRGFRTRLEAVGRAVDGGLGGGWLGSHVFG